MEPSEIECFYVGAFRALSRSVSFVKNNFKTTLGIAGLYIIATAFTGAIFPGGGGGGGGGDLVAPTVSL